MKFLPGILVALLAAVAWDWGGYDPWAVLALELGSAALLLALFWLRSSDRRPEVADGRYEAWRRLPYWVRHPELANVVRVFTLGRFPKAGSSGDVEILLPGGRGRAPVDLDLSKEGFLLGFAVKRTGLLAPLALLTLWMAVSLLPLTRPVLSWLSPEAATLRTETETLLDGNPEASPWSLAPYASLRGLWLWLAVLGVFYSSFRVARRPEGSRRLGLAFLMLSAASGLYAVGRFLGDLQSAHGIASEALRASGSFGNPNHYAAFQSMLLLSSLGFFSWLRAKAGRTVRPLRGDDGGLAAIAGIGIVVSALGLLLSLSRSGIASSLAGALAFAMLIRRAEGASRRRILGPLAAVALVIGGIFLWIGIEPLVGRFTGLAEQWNEEATRVQVWRDSAPAVADFWITGSGLGSFRYVSGIYRSFGGRIFYSWAHNDYLQLAIELGVPGALLLLWLALAILRAARRARRDLLPDRSLYALHAGFASALVAVGLHSFTDFSLHLPANLALAAALTGAVVGMEREAPNQLD